MKDMDSDLLDSQSYVNIQIAQQYFDPMSQQ